MAWSYEELEQRLEKYEVAVSVRGSTFLKVFFGIFGAAIAVVVLFMTNILPTPVAETCLAAALIAFCLLAAYIAFTAKAFHEANGVFCPHCDASLATLGDALEGFEEDGIERPESMECPQCHRVVVQKKAQ
ncbi:MAG: hypothetical protein PHQ60_01230 [Sideroxydans sp.]|nr:hypothetical protein [Sideroxydans sp.]